LLAKRRAKNRNVSCVPNLKFPKSVLGHKRPMSVLPSKADIRQREWRVRYVPQADIQSRWRPHNPRLSVAE